MSGEIDEVVQAEQTPLADEVPPTEDAAKPTDADDDADDESKDADDDESDGKDDDPGKRKRPGKYQRTVQRLEQQNLALAQQLQALTQHVQGRGVPPQAQRAVPAGDAPPRPEQFQTYEDYVTAKAQHGLRQEMRNIQAAQVRAQQQAQQAEVVDGFKGRLDEGAERYADFNEVVFNPNVDISTAMVEALVDCESGAEVAYWLGKNPKEAKRIAGMPRAAAAREIGKLEAKLSSQQPRTTNAPPPVRTVSGRGSGERDPAKMSMAEYRAWRMGNK